MAEDKDFDREAEFAELILWREGSVRSCEGRRRRPERGLERGRDGACCVYLR